MAEKYQITKKNLKSLLDWKAIIRQDNCKVKVRNEIVEGNEGHDNCEEGCVGNYWNGGDCNFSENYDETHTLANDLKNINDKFGLIDRVAQYHDALRDSNDEAKFLSLKEEFKNTVGEATNVLNNPGGFFYGTCFSEHDNKHSIIFVKGLEKRFASLADNLTKYLKLIDKVSYEKATEFKDKVREISDLENDQKKLKGGQLKSNRAAIKRIIDELTNSPDVVLFLKSSKDTLWASKKELVEPSRNNFWDDLGTMAKKDRIIFGNEEISSEEKINSETPNEGGWPWGTIALYGGGGLVVVIGLVLIYKWSQSKIS